MQIVIFFFPLGLRESLHSEFLTYSQGKLMLQSSEHILGSKDLSDRGPKPEPGSDNGKAEERT